MSVRPLASRQSVFQWHHSEKHLSEFYPQDGGESQLALKLRHRHPVYRSLIGSHQSNATIGALLRRSEVPEIAISPILVPALSMRLDYCSSRSALFIALESLRTGAHIHHDAEKNNRFSFVCIFFNTWQKLVIFSHTLTKVYTTIPCI